MRPDGLYIHFIGQSDMYIQFPMDNKNKTMEQEKIELLLEKLTSAAAEFAFEASEQDYCIKVSISCHDGWADVKKI